jgi:hypothetical protein
MDNNEGSILSNYHEEWVVLVNKALGNFDSLAPAERVWFTVQALMQDVDNGGFIGHYCNYGGERNKETIEDLITLGFPDVADMLKKINALFPDSTPPVGIQERNAAMQAWEGEKYDFLDDFFDQLDQQFYRREPAIVAELGKLIASTILFE